MKRPPPPETAHTNAVSVLILRNLWEWPPTRRGFCGQPRSVLGVIVTAPRSEPLHHCVAQSNPRGQHTNTEPLFAQRQYLRSHPRGHFPLSGATVRINLGHVP